MNYNNILTTETPQGADYITCPICNISNEPIAIICDNIDYCDYCSECNFTFITSHIYEFNGCTDSIMFIETIIQYSFNGEIKNEKIDIKYILDNHSESVSYDDGDIVIKGLKILKTKCSCNGIIKGPNGYYKDDQYYKFDCPIYYSYD